MQFEWDETKSRSNIHLHGIDFVEVEKVFAGETVTVLDDRFDYGEIRLLTFGLLNEKVVAIAHTETEGIVRVISARKASRNEEIFYFQEIKD